MGRWMEVVDACHPLGVSPPIGSSAVLVEMSPYELIDAARHVPRRARQSFPWLVRVCPQLSASYEDEHLWLTASEVRALLEEWERLLRVCELREFLPDVDGKRVLKYWKESSSKADFDESIGVLRAALKLAVEKGASLHLML